VRAGHGLAVVSAQTLDLELQTGCLAVLSVEGFPIVRHWYVAHRTQKRLSAAASTFRDLLLALEPASAQCRPSHINGRRVSPTPAAASA
jgi:DNA-binding transcriptional LysR family regulator